MTSYSNAVLTELHYLPCIEYFDCLNSFELIIFEQKEYYRKQTYRNRCYILGANKVEALVVPINKSHTKYIRDVSIDYSDRWDKVHWRSIEAAYRKSPFFEYFAPYLQDVYEQKPKFLWDLNLNLLKACFKIAQIQKNILLTEKYEDSPTDIFDARGLFDFKKNTPDSKFSKNRTYRQTFGQEFIPNLSIIDLLFNSRKIV